MNGPLPSNDGMVLVKGAAGLGNRIFSLLTAAVYAELAGRTAVVDWRDAVFAPNGDEATKHVDLFPLLFKPGVLRGWEPLDDSDLVPAVWRGNLDVSAVDLLLRLDPAKATAFRATAITSARPDKLDYSERLVVMWSWRERILPMRKHLRQHPEYRGLSDFHLLRLACRRLLVPSDRVREQVDRVWAETGGDPVLGLHVRQSDLKAPVGVLIRKVERVLRNSSAKSLFLATDSGEVEGQIKKRFAGLPVITLHKEFPEPGTPLHYDLSCRDRVTRACDCLADMLLLARCSELIYAGRSSFALVARLFAADDQRAFDCDRFVAPVVFKKFVQKHVCR